MSDRDDRRGGGSEDYAWLFDDSAPASPRSSEPQDRPVDPADAATQAIPHRVATTTATTRMMPTSAGSTGSAVDTAVAPPGAQNPRTTGPARSSRAGSPPPGSPPPGSPPPGSRPAGSPPAPAGPRKSRARLVRRIVVVLIAALLAFYVITPIWAWSHVGRVKAEQSSAATSGKNFLVVGSDKRSDLSAAERKKLGTGTAAGQRTDSIMLLHMPADGKPTLVSLPRDSYVSIPGHGRNKINAAFAFGGPTLLVKTVELATGLHVDGYIEVGFGGFVDVVDSVGGVSMCLAKPMKDKDAHINLEAGCQELDGTQALGFVRARHSQAKGDLDRVDHQRQLLAAITQKALSPATLLPWRYYGLFSSGANSLSIGEKTSLPDMVSFAKGMKAVSSGSGTTTTVPIADASYQTSAGSSVLWDHDKAVTFFKKLEQN